MQLFELTKMSTSGIGTTCLSIWINHLFLKQGTSFIVKLVRLFSVIQRQFEMPSTVTMYKWQNWCHCTHPYLGKRLSITVFLLNLIFYNILERTSANDHRPKLLAVKQWSSILNSEMHKRRLYQGTRLLQLRTSQLTLIFPPINWRKVANS